MKSLREILIGLFTALASVLLIFGAISLSTAEDAVSVIPIIRQPTNTQAVKATATDPGGILSEKTLVVDVKETATPQSTETQKAAVSPTATATTACQTPDGWHSYTILAGDTLENLSESSKTTILKLKEANCLVSDTLLPGTIIYLPPNNRDKNPHATENGHKYPVQQSTLRLDNLYCQTWRHPDSDQLPLPGECERPAKIQLPRQFLCHPGWTKTLCPLPRHNCAHNPVLLDTISHSNLGAVEDQHAVSYCHAAGWLQYRPA